MNYGLCVGLNVWAVYELFVGALTAHSGHKDSWSVDLSRCFTIKKKTFKRGRKVIPRSIPSREEEKKGTEQRIATKNAHHQRKRQWKCETEELRGSTPGEKKSRNSNREWCNWIFFTVLGGVLVTAWASFTPKFIFFLFACAKFNCDRAVFFLLCSSIGSPMLISFPGQGVQVWEARLSSADLPLDVYLKKWSKFNPGRSLNECGVIRLNKVKLMQENLREAS